MSQTNNPTILIVEDTQDVANIIFITLKRMPLNLVHVKTGAEAIDAAYQSTPDLIILDIGLPGMDGWEVLDEIRKKDALSNVPVVVITAFSDAENRKTGKLYKVFKYLAKPVTPQVIRETVSEALSL